MSKRVNIFNIIDVIVGILIAVILLTVVGVIMATASNATEGGHTAVTFCHKPGEPAQKELTTDDDGFLQGHLGHGDTLGACPVEEVPPVCEVAFDMYGRVILEADCTQITYDGPPVVEQPQLCEEQIGRRIDGEDGKAYVVIDVTDDCEPVLELINEDSPLWDCTTMGNLQCGVLIDCTWWIIHYENGVEVSRNIRELYPNEVSDACPAQPVVEQTVAPVTSEILTVAPEPAKSVGTAEPQLAETGTKDVVGGLLIAAGLVGLGTFFLRLAQKRRNA